ncbi:hypothetical protein RRG08_063105 [Elysia crispata]|uniref:Uncharacterized protein n=1 Tax=Elysia crispata TaxID=231223 RepID=A0AAE0YFR2_9GAST|nr:hypothetical protein RRG08_063105 [Elysia crispata]
MKASVDIQLISRCFGTAPVLMFYRQQNQQAECSGVATAPIHKINGSDSIVPSVPSVSWTVVYSTSANFNKCNVFNMFDNLIDSVEVRRIQLQDKDINDWSKSCNLANQDRSRDVMEKYSSQKRV